MSLSRSLSRMLLLCCILLATVFALAAPAPAATGPASSSSIAIQTYLQPDLSLKSAFVADSFTGKSAALAGRTCRCSCGFPCKTDADCGGGICSGGISCCDRTSQDQAWNSTSASRKHPSPVFAAKCN
jgi:hypothetical protein